MPEGEQSQMQGGEIPQMPEGEQSQMQGGEMPQMPEGEQSQMQGGEMPQMSGGMKGFGTGTGCDLVYTGDDLDNYSAIWDSSVFKTTNKDHKRVVEALKNIKEGNLEGYLNVDTMLRYIAVNSVIVNYDSYFGNLQHNYYLYEKDGELTMLPWDYNLAFAGFQMNDATSAINDPIDTPVSGTTLEDRPLIGQVLADEENMNQYHNYLSQIVSEYFDSGYWEETIDKVDALISEYVRNDPSAFYTYDEYKTAIENLKQFGLLRAKSITGQLDGTIPSTKEEQSENKDCLIDPENVSITAMGTQGGGKGDMPQGGFHEMNQEENNTNESKTPFTQGANLKMNRPDVKQMGVMDDQSENNTQNVVVNTICIIIAIISAIFVRFYKRRKLKV